MIDISVNPAVNNWINEVEDAKILMKEWINEKKKNLKECQNTHKSAVNASVWMVEGNKSWMMYNMKTIKLINLVNRGTPVKTSFTL